jgi:ribosomal protein S18 acetylase RimI-like enzyme
MSDIPSPSGAQSPGNGPARVRAMRCEEAAQVVAWHSEEFPAGFYVRLGPHFLRAYYRGFVRSPHAAAFVAVAADGQLVGYLAGTLDAAKHSWWMLWRHGLVLTMVGLLCLLRRPRLWPDFVRSRAVWYARRVLRTVVGMTRRAPVASRTGELTYLVCSAKFRGRGIGTQLVAAFDRQASAAGISRLTLVTAADDHRVRAFYEALGWRLAGTRWTRDGRELAAFEVPLAVSMSVARHSPTRAAMRQLGQWARSSPVHRSLATVTAITALAAACTAQAGVAHSPARPAEAPVPTPSTSPAPQSSPSPTPTQTTSDGPRPSTPKADAVIVAVPAGQWSRIVATGVWRPGCTVTRTGLRRVEVNHYDFAGRVRRGVLVVNADVAANVARIFTQLFDAKFPIRRMRPVEEYGGDNTLSLAADNTAAYNCRRLSQINAPVAESPHANGRAIDINPYENPWIDLRCDCWKPAATYATKRTGPGVITKGSLPWRVFTGQGWIWQNIKTPDYMHFDTGYPSRPLPRR